MEIPLYLAMTAGEFSACSSPPPYMAWMACHFSSSGDGLSNIPAYLPEHSLLILDDSIPMANHRIERILQQLLGAVENLRPDGVLLDFQRPGASQTAELAEEILSVLPCPVGVSHHYAGNLNCPIFLPPIPAHKSPADYLAPYDGRELWLETAPVWERITVTEAGSQYRHLEGHAFSPGPHRDDTLHCHYGMAVREDSIIFSLCRTREDLNKLLREENLGITRAVGLYQELG